MISYAGKNRQAVNFLKTMYFDYPEWTICGVGFLPAVWMTHGARLEELVLSHPRVFPYHRKGSIDFDNPPFWDETYELGRHTDCWGSIWKNICRGMAGQVEREPLTDWADFEAWKTRLPDPVKDDMFGPRTPPEQIARELVDARGRGDIASANPLWHGHFFMRLYYLRGFENLMLDIATDEPRLRELIRILTDYNTAVVANYLSAGAEMMCLGEDLGMQTSLPISPEAWRKFVKPSYMETLAPCRRADVPVYLHSDGHILEIIDDLIECGVRVLNPQIRANGLSGLQRLARGKVALNQDLDRQLFPFATPSQIEDHIGEVFEGLYDKKGGLMLLAEIGPEVPLDNLEAICRTFEKLCNLPEPPPNV
jgi:hypothetical protein